MGRYIPNDKWARKAKEHHFRARSVFKLQELNERFRLLRPGLRVLDCGAAPGSWLQEVADKIGPKGHALGIDLQVIAPIAPQITTIVGDITDPKLADVIAPHAPFDLVLSDIAPSTSGIKDVDQWRSIELSQHVFDLALKFLRPGGRCVMKILRGGDFDEFYGVVRQHFSTVRIATVKATRDSSREVYLVCFGRK